MRTTTNTRHELTVAAGNKFKFANASIFASFWYVKENTELVNTLGLRENGGEGVKGAWVLMGEGLL